MSEQDKEQALRGGGVGGDEAAPAWRGSSFEEVTPVQARRCAGCKLVYADAATARGCERSHKATIEGLCRGDRCPLCRNIYPAHDAGCESQPSACNDCGQITTHCERGHCQECWTDWAGFPVEDCAACYETCGAIPVRSIEAA